MCVIIDANIAGEFVSRTEDCIPVVQGLVHGSIKIVSGHKMKEELLKCSFRSLYKQLIMAGRIIEFDALSIEREMENIDKKQLKSNDGHIIGLARASGARILFSKDGNLHADFKNPRLISEPRGNVYQNKKHEHLLKRRRICSC
jgi:hypothetical protein